MPDPAPALPVAYLLCGPSLAGKTTLRRELAARLSLAIIALDEINAEQGVPFGADGSPEAWGRTLELALGRLDARLAEGASVVVDDTLCFRWLRERFVEATLRRKAQPRLIHLDPPVDVLFARHAELSASGARPVLDPECFTEHLRTFEPPAPEEDALRFTSSEKALVWAQNLRQGRAGWAIR